MLRNFQHPPGSGRLRSFIASRDIQIRMFCAGSCLSPRFPESAGGGLGLWVVQDRPARPSGRGRRALELSLGVPGAGLRPGAGVLCRRDLGFGRRWQSGLVPCGILAGLGRLPVRRPWRARSISAWADPAASRARAASCPAFRARDPASPARRPGWPQRRAAARSTPARCGPGPRLIRTARMGRI